MLLIYYFMICLIFIFFILYFLIVISGLLSIILNEILLAFLYLNFVILHYFLHLLAVFSLSYSVILRYLQKDNCSDIKIVIPWNKVNFSIHFVIILMPIHLFPFVYVFPLRNPQLLICHTSFCISLLFTNKDAGHRVDRA